jgi:hypothetical protein
VIEVKYHLNFGKKDYNYILLCEIFKNVDYGISQKILASHNVKNIKYLLSLKNLFTRIFNDLNINFIVNNLIIVKKTYEFI